jgi:2'-5' RNA ligase
MTNQNSGGSPSVAPSPSFKSHWWWRPGWRPGRRMYTFFLTLNDRPDIAQRIAAYYAEALRDPILDVVPPEWMHLTVQGVGFTDEVAADELNPVLSELQHRCSSVQPIAMTLGSPVVAEEGVVLTLSPLESARELRTIVRTVLTEVRDPRELDGGDSFTPHLTIAYSNSTGPADEIVQKLNNLPKLPLTIMFDQLRLISLGRDRHMYEWDEVGQIKFGSAEVV